MHRSKKNRSSKKLMPYTPFFVLAIFMLTFIMEGFPYRYLISAILFIWMMRNIYVELSRRHIRRGKVIFILFLILAIALISRVLDLHYNMK